MMLKRWLPTFILVAAVLASYPFLVQHDDKPVTGLPWQIERLDDGNIEVFGLVPGKTTLQQAIDRLGEDFELAVIAQRGERSGSLELYYDRYRAGLLGGKMVLVADADAARLERWRDRAVEQEALQSGARKYVLAGAQRQDALASTISGITFIPSVNLDDEVIRERFGEPADLVPAEEGVVHYLYPDRGLDVVLDENGREVLQYVAPSDFDRLLKPLT